MSKRDFPSSNSQLIVRFSRFCLAAILMLGLFFSNSLQVKADADVPVRSIFNENEMVSPMTSSLLLADAAVEETEEVEETPEAKAVAKKAKEEAKAAAKAAKKAAKLEAKKAKEAAKLEAKKLKAEKKAAEKKEVEEKATPEEASTPESVESPVTAIEAVPSEEVAP